MPRRCSTDIARGSSGPASGCSGATSRRPPCIRNGAATATPGDARRTRCTSRYSRTAGRPPKCGLRSPFYPSHRARAMRGNRIAQMRRRLAEGPDQRDFPALVEFHAEGATDYFAAIYIFGERGDPAQGEGVVDLVHDRRAGRFRRWRGRIHRGDAAGDFAGAQGPCGAPDRVESVAHLPRRARRPARAFGFGAARRRRKPAGGAALRRRARLHEAQRHHCRAPRSSTCSTRSSRR